MSGTFPLGPSWNPAWQPGYVPAAQEWNAAWSNKLDTDDAKLTGAPWLPESGGTLSGPLILYGMPMQPLEAATKSYVDQFTPVTGPYLPQSGGTMTGILTLATDPTGALDAATKRYVDVAGGNAQNALTIANNALQRTGGVMTGPITLAGDPGVPLAAATKQYVDRFLPLTGGTTSGSIATGANADIYAGRNLYCFGTFYASSFNGWEWAFEVDNSTGNKIQQYRAGWYDFWNGTDGSRHWVGPGGDLMNVTGGGTLYVRNGISLSGNGVFYNNFSGHAHAFGWNGNVNLYVDGQYEGDIATTGYVAGGLAAYLPLGGGHMSGNLGVDGAVNIGINPLQTAGQVVVGTYLTSTNHADIGNEGVYYAGTGSTYGFQFWFQSPNLYVRLNGNFDAFLANLCDERFKQDIAPTQVDCLDIIRRTPLYQFRSRPIGKRGKAIDDVADIGKILDVTPDTPITPLGFVAQRQREVFPESVIGELSLTIDMHTMVAALCGAVQTLANRLDALTGAAKEA